MATFLFVPGAWHGGWCWKKLTPHLRAAGHEVYAPSLTGLGERSHLLTPEIDLDTHVQDGSYLPVTFPQNGSDALEHGQGNLHTFYAGLLAESGTQPRPIIGLIAHIRRSEG